MVALLWRNEQRHAAIILEGYWNRLLAAHPCRLFCAYPIDVLTDDLDDPLVSCALAAHSHLMPCGEDVDRAVELAVDEVLGAKAESVRLGIEAKRHSSGRAAGPSESIVFWLRRSVPEYAEQILERARSHYRLGMAGSR
jgi:hypothetical protein